MHYCLPEEAQPISRTKRAPPYHFHEHTLLPLQLVGGPQHGATLLGWGEKVPQLVQDLLESKCPCFHGHLPPLDLLHSPNNHQSLCLLLFECLLAGSPLLTEVILAGEERWLAWYWTGEIQLVPKQLCV